MTQFYLNNHQTSSMAITCNKQVRSLYRCTRSMPV